jgi:Domain of unknown function (DUF4037)
MDRATLPDGLTHLEATWAEKLMLYLPNLAMTPELAPLSRSWAVLLHGSTTEGLDDAHSDLDLWALVPPAGLAAFDQRSPTRFVQFRLQDKPGHLNVTDAVDFEADVRRCRMPLLAELRRAVLLADRNGLAARLIEAARQPMPEDVRLAWFRFHYVEMRSHHKNADNTLARHDAVASLLATSNAVAHGLRAAMILDAEPYPYEKWLAAKAYASPTGALLQPAVERLLLALDHQELTSGAALDAALKDMRLVLIDRARDRGLDGPWLDRWWLHIDQARTGIQTVGWRP